MTAEDIGWISSKLFDRDKLCSENCLQFLESMLSLLLEIGIVINWLEDWVLKEFLPASFLFFVDAQKFECNILSAHALIF